MQQPEEDYKEEITGYREEDHPILILLKAKDKDIKTKLKELQGLCKNKEGNVGAYIIYNQDPNNLNYNNILHYLINRLNGWNQDLKQEDIIKFIDIILGYPVKELSKEIENDKYLWQGFKYKQLEKLDEEHKKVRATLLTQKNAQGKTVLAQAVEVENYQLIEDLLRLGADPSTEIVIDIKDNKSLKAKNLLEIAIINRNVRMIKLLNRKFNNIINISQEDIRFLVKEKLWELLDKVNIKELIKYISNNSENNQASIMRMISKRKELLLSTLLDDYKKTMEENSANFYYQFFKYYSPTELWVIPRGFSKPVTEDALELIDQFKKIKLTHLDAIKLFNLLQRSSFNKEEIINLLQQEIWVNYIGYGEKTILYYAVEQYEDEKSLDAFYKHPLLYHLYNQQKHNDYIEVIRLLLDRGAEITDKVLSRAINDNKIKIVELLMQYPFKTTMDTIRESIINPDITIEMFELLLKHLSNIEELLIDRAIMGDSGDLIELCFKYGNELNVINVVSETLFRATLNNCENVVKALLKNEKVDPNIKFYGITALHLAVSKGYKDIIMLLLQHGADPTILNNESKSPLDHAMSMQISDDNIETIQLLLKHGAKITDKTIYRAVISDDIKMTEFLLENGASIIKTMYEAARLGRVDIIELCFNYGAEPNMVITETFTALDVASIHGKKNAINFLLKDKNIDPNIKGKHGYTAIFLATASNYGESVKILLNEKVDPNIKCHGITALHKAVENKNEKIVETFCLTKTTKLDIQDEKGNTALHLAVLIGNKDIIMLLLQHGADPNILNNDGKSPLAIAEELDCADIINIMTTPSTWLTNYTPHEALEEIIVHRSSGI